MYKNLKHLPKREACVRKIAVLELRSHPVLFLLLKVTLDVSAQRSHLLLKFIIVKWERFRFQFNKVV